ncbi:MAG: hypothetical protein ACOYBP_08970 [Microbacteriaceae bacterium]
MAIATSEVESFVALLATNEHVLKGMVELVASNLAALSSATPRLSGSNTFVNGTLILDNQGNSEWNVIEQKRSPHFQTGNSSNHWVALTKSWTGIVSSGQEATVRTYTGDGLDVHKAYFAIVVNAEWNLGAQKWQCRNPSLPCYALFFGTYGLFNGFKAAQPTGSQWDTWSRFGGTEVVNLRLAEGGMIGPLSWGSDGSLSFDKEQWANYQSEFGATDLASMFGRGIYIPLDIKPGEPIGTVTIRTNAAVAGDIFRLRKRYTLTGTPAFSTLGSFTVATTGNVDATINYTGNLADIAGNAEYGVLWTLDSATTGSPPPSSDPAFANKILGCFRSNY